MIIEYIPSREAARKTRTLLVSLVGKMDISVEVKCMFLPRAVMQNTVAGVGHSLRTTVDSPYGKYIELGICPH